MWQFWPYFYLSLLKLDFHGVKCKAGLLCEYKLIKLPSYSSTNSVVSYIDISQTFFSLIFANYWASHKNHLLIRSKSDQNWMGHISNPQIVHSPNLEYSLLNLFQSFTAPLVFPTHNMEYSPLKLLKPFIVPVFPSHHQHGNPAQIFHLNYMPLLGKDCCHKYQAIKTSKMGADSLRLMIKF